jgi:MFS transporter, OFA family, oxalate/formate antiporter
MKSGQQTSLIGEVSRRTSSAATVSTRWGILACGIICMMMIANLQYGWTLFVNPIATKHGWSIAAVQVAFSIFIALETWLTPISQRMPR